MSNDKTGGQAFPVWELNGQGKAEMTDFGMTLRDYFAAKAMQSGFLAFMRHEDNAVDEASVSAMREIAKESYLLADAMLEARKS